MLFTNLILGSSGGSGQMTSAGFAAFIKNDYEHMREAAKLAGIVPQ